MKQWLADASYIDQHSDMNQATDMIVDAWFDYWIEMKEKTVRPNTSRNYREQYERNKSRGRCIESHIKLNAKWHSVALDVALGQISKTQKPRKFKDF